MVRNREFWVIIFFGSLMACLPTIIRDPYYIHVLIFIMFYAFLGASWNILGGFAGQLSLGHGAFIGIGAYTSTMLFAKLDLSPWIGMLAGALLAASFGLFIGVLCFRYGLKGPYFALATIAFSEVLKIIGINWHFVGGSEGFLVPLRAGSIRDFQFAGKDLYYYVILAMVILILVVSLRVKNSKLGYYFVAIRENENAAQALGINSNRFKVMAAFISAFFTALGGTFYAQYILYLTPENTMGLHMSIRIVVIPIIGGIGTVFGPLLGSFILQPVSELTRSMLGAGYTGSHLMVYGAILMLAIIYMPHGVVKVVQDFYAKLPKKLG